ncbi:MAG: HPr(Ser) kinase/phosphatase [Defluviitaleaceae bacterium]|nr:HPr(Ser) kinase/phosphatase [Defluviitaleaceae bacterium]MCL2239022.1 HPr(Ser) kinase/phosphatase [Defluviitaleaceae bacterium]
MSAGLAASGVLNTPSTGYTVPLDLLMNEFNLDLLTPAVDIEKKVLTRANINRPALQLAGFFDYFDPTRLQVIGMVEHTYLTKLEENFRNENLRRIFQHRIPAIVMCRKLGLFPEMLDYAERYDVPIFSTPWSTTDFISEIIRWMKVQLAPRITMHGCLLDIYGVGTLIVGESGVGKSETSLELIKRGHRFIADDAVEVRRVSSETLIGSCPANIRYFLELRGIGIIDIMQMFGVQSIKPTQSIELIINLELWDPTRVYDRLGQVEEYTDVLGNKVCSHSIPIRPGRSLSILCESAAINHRQKKLGYNAAEALTERVLKNSSGVMRIHDVY